MYPRLLMRCSVMVIAAAAAFFLLFQAQASELKRALTSRLEDAKETLNAIEQGHDSVFAAGEIAVARRWLADASKMLESGKQKRAAVLAERLPSQLALISKIMEAGRLSKAAEEVELEVYRSEQKLHGVEAKIRRLSLKLKGPQLLGARPLTGQEGR